MRSVSRAIALLFLPALLLAQTTPHVGGYLQSRETYQEHVGLTASVNRARVSVDGGLPQHFSYRVLVEYEANGSAFSGRRSGARGTTPPQRAASTSIFRVVGRASSRTTCRAGSRSPARSPLR
ncbi:MAG TPA: hypothetical protein VFP39_05590 [Gemmatimonadales bacterium]|nr:hypothetical protein [Gemmatimonadales bacterium]